MGFLATDITPISSTGPTVLIPVAKDLQCKVFSVARTDTVSVLKAVLAADASVTSVKLYGSTVSNAATTATVTVTISNNTGVISTGTYDVKANGATTGAIQMTALPNIQPIPLTGDLQVKAVYAETGGASSSGGPWFVEVQFVR